MIKKFLFIFAAAFILIGCSRQQQNTNMVNTKEVAADFSTQPQPPSITVNPRLAGKAQLPAAPVRDVQTQTGSATVLPSQNQTIEVPAVEAQPVTTQ